MKLQDVNVTWLAQGGDKGRVITAETALKRLRCGDVLLVASNSLLSTVIRNFTYRDAKPGMPVYTHAEMIKGQEEEEDGSLTCVSWSAEYRGLIPRETGRHLERVSWGEIWRNEDFVEHDWYDIQKIVQIMMRKGGEYDYGGFLRFARMLRFMAVPGARAYTCGESVVRILRKIKHDIFLTGENPEDISPAELGRRFLEIASSLQWQKMCGRWTKLAEWDLRPTPKPDRKLVLPQAPASCLLLPVAA